MTTLLNNRQHSIDINQSFFPNRFSHSQLAIFFGNSRVEGIQRSPLYTVPDFMAVCGGLLGLFLGLSTLSIIQFIHSFAIRLFCLIRQFKHDNDVIPIQQNAVISKDTIKEINISN